MSPDDFRDARIALQMTQQQLADALGVTRGHVDKLERGVHPVRPVYVLALEALTARRQPHG